MNTAKPIRILVVDDDQTFRERLSRALSARGFEVAPAANAREAVEVAGRFRPQRAVVDLKMPGAGGLELVRDLAAMDSGMQIVVLTAYGTIPSAVEAVRRGAVNYLSKPSDTEQILAAFEPDRDLSARAAGEETPSLARVEWEHIQRILDDCHANISETARRLGIHRRSLQRKLQKLPPL